GAFDWSSQVRDEPGNFPAPVAESGSPGLVYSQLFTGNLCLPSRRLSPQPKMNPRIVHEARLIFWPWCLMTLAGVAPLIRFALENKRADWPDGIAVFGFFGGAAILTARSFRHAHSAYSSSLLSAVIHDRQKLWSEKMTVLTVAVACASLIACLVQT